jgi:PIN domain nuclease of toxin-antitoxin system
VWLARRHRRGEALARSHARLYASPASVLELQLLVESGRLSLREGATVTELVEHGPWAVDDPPAAAWFVRTLDLGWTRDPFDRLLVAHARLRGWRLATGDAELVERLGRAGCIEL